MVNECSNCRFWLKEGAEDPGVCRRYPPSVVARPSGVVHGGQGGQVEIRAFFPNMMSFAWCGEWAEKATQ